MCPPDCLAALLSTGLLWVISQGIVRRVKQQRLKIGLKPVVKVPDSSLRYTIELKKDVSTALFIVDSSHFFGTRPQNPLCNRPPAACDRAPSPARPLTRVWEGRPVAVGDRMRCSLGWRCGYCHPRHVADRL